ncbi:MAG: tripartite tricarboxylate transporter substrate binding protein [Betaproteobacteria bacterium]|nr:tripartite tricarboxylate transporter substrate binding protein [Betaproteobacteria bacterium]MDH4325008.1 tripartite tricarboxylate transporter substrate binding protein [Betaproteobacteria bacterium]
MGFSKLLFVALAATLAAPQALAQTYPNKPVRLIIAFTPGSSTDIIGRAVAAKLAEIWGQPVVAENRAGAGGSVGSAAMLREAPDGYTLLANSSAHVANPSIYANLPYDTLKDFANIAPLAGGPNVLIVGTGVGWKSFADFIAAAKAKPGTLNFSSAGIGSGTHFNLEKLKLMAGIDVVHVPYKGTPEAIGDTIAGRVCCYFAPINAALPHVAGGKAVALALTSAQRSPLLPNVPTIAESGVPGFDYTLWIGLWGSAAMPPALVDKINADVRKALSSPDLKERLTKLGTLPADMSAQDFAQYVRREVEDTARVLKAAGIKPQ